MSRVATRLVTVSTGRMPACHCAETMPAPDPGSTPIVALPDSARHVFSIERWNGVGAPTMAGTHTRVAPDGLSTSTEAVISNVRQAPASSGAAAAGRVAAGHASPTDTRPEYSRKRRLFIILLGRAPGAERCSGARRPADSRGSDHVQ